MPATYGSISEYDMILSVSEEAINGQLESLYKTAIPDTKDGKKFVPKSAKVKGFVPAPPAKYLIDHDLVLYGFDEDNKIEDDWGLKAHIECPKISFHDDRSIRVHLKFTTDPTNAAQPRSEWKYWKGRGPNAELMSVDVTGLGFTWAVQLGKKEYKSIIEDLINPSNDPDHHILLPPNAEDELSKLNSAIFLPSTIFCLSEATRLAGTIQITDASGQPTKGFRGSGDCLISLANYFANMPQDPTPQNLFLLGYGLTQKIQPLEEIDEDLRSEATPPMFIPFKFDLSTTVASDPRLNSLNYCMLTHRTRDNYADAQLVRKTTFNNPPGAGTIYPNLFDVTRSNYNSGVLAFCRDAFFIDLIFNTINNIFFIDVRGGVQWIIDNVGGCKEGESVGEENHSIDSKVYPGELKVERTSSAHSKKTLLDEGAWKLRAFTHGNSSAVTTVDADSLGWSGSGPVPSDWRREVRIKTEFKMNIETWGQTAAVGKDVNDPDDSGSWSQVYQSKLTARYCIELVFQAGSAGKWDVSVRSGTGIPEWDSTNSCITNMQDMGDKHAPDSGYGTWVENHKWHDIFGLDFYGFDAWMRYSKDLANNYLGFWGGEKINEKLSAYLDETRTNIMSPAGEVFTFKGMDVDRDGNLYTHVTYAVGDAQRWKP